MTEWHARRVGDRILCGRSTSNSGGCRGEIATISTTVGPVDRPGYREAKRGELVEIVHLPLGLVEDPPGSGVWRATARARRRCILRPRYPFVDKDDYRRRGDGPDQSSLVLPPALPLRRRCPVCDVTAIVEPNLLE
jgi:hypothetical protein